MIDSVHLFAKAVDNYFNGLDDFSTQTINCQSRSNDNMWAAGESIYNEFSSVSGCALNSTDNHTCALISTDNLICVCALIFTDSHSCLFWH